MVEVGATAAYAYLNSRADFFVLILMCMHLIGLRPESEAPYRAKIHISEPNFKEDKGFPNHGIAEGSLEFEAYIKVDKAKGSLIVPDAEEKIAVLGI
ncbi:MAG: hypothetical protein MW690_000167 [Methanophagales archaeon]|nr:hypothetical protein [Methanophagales archaeon]MCU4140482.1 hypothetical protein [Methanophagales archaeon]